MKPSVRSEFASGFRSISAALGLMGICSGLATAAEKPAFESGRDARAVRGAMIMPTRIPSDYKLLYEQRFLSADALNEFVFTDPGAWRHALEQGNGALELARQSQYKPAVRSPVNIALLGSQAFGDFILEVDLIQTGKEYGHRDMCVFYGVQNPTNFYYTHIATAADDHAHNTFIVTNAPRIKIAKQTTTGANWGLGVWHTVRIERTVADGAIRVYFDDLTKPIMIAEDRTFGAGFVGFGSFDDTGMVDNVRIWGPTKESRTATFFRRRAAK